MCEATVIMKKDGNDEEIMKEVELIEDNSGLLKIVDIMGKELDIKGRITRIDLIKNRIFIAE